MGPAGEMIHFGDFFSQVGEKFVHESISLKRVSFNYFKNFSEKCDRKAGR